MEQEAMKKAKQKQRERVTPKMGKIDLDYQVRIYAVRNSALLQHNVELVLGNSEV
jgi:hypothetical protein